MESPCMQEIMHTARIIQLHVRTGAVDENGCCAGEIYTDMGDLGFNCCPADGDCFPPIK